jgi:hypothetical protein
MGEINRKKGKKFLIINALSEFIAGGWQAH